MCSTLPAVRANMQWWTARLERTMHHCIPSITLQYIATPHPPTTPTTSKNRQHVHRWTVPHGVRGYVCVEAEDGTPPVKMVQNEGLSYH